MSLVGVVTAVTSASVGAVVSVAVVGVKESSAGSSVPLPQAVSNQPSVNSRMANASRSLQGRFLMNRPWVTRFKI